jgi:hypothetical protein
MITIQRVPVLTPEACFKETMPCYLEAKHRATQADGITKLSMRTHHVLNSKWQTIVLKALPRSVNQPQLFAATAPNAHQCCEGLTRGGSQTKIKRRQVDSESISL